MSQPVFRFAPSPTGYLHIGHAYAALYNQNICKAYHGKMLLRLENTDVTRCRPEFEAAILEDLRWIGFEWQGEVRRQSEHFDVYARIVDQLTDQNLIYPSTMSRGQSLKQVQLLEERGAEWPRDPDGAPHYPGLERELGPAAKQQIMAEHSDYALRLDMQGAIDLLAKEGKGSLYWNEFCHGDGRIEQIGCQPELWGDVVLARKDIAARYHLACVIDDHLQDVTHIVRGKDIMPGTSIHRVLQELLGYQAPVYCHHDLIDDGKGQKLSKSRKDISLRELREAGASPDDIHKLIGLRP